MPHFKKIAVCHGKSCKPAGAAAIKKILEQEYLEQSVEITERECCGRCEHSCTIAVDDQLVSDLNPENLRTTFLDRTEEALSDARKRDQAARDNLDAILGDDFLPDQTH